MLNENNDFVTKHVAKTTGERIKLPLTREMHNIYKEEDIKAKFLKIMSIMDFLIEEGKEEDLLNMLRPYEKIKNTIDTYDNEILVESATKLYINLLAEVLFKSIIYEYTTDEETIKTILEI